MESLEQAKSFLYQQDFNQAFILAKEAVEEPHATDEAFYFLAHLYEHYKTDSLIAHQLLDRGMELTEKKSRFFCYKAKLFLRDKDYLRAKELLHKAWEDVGENDPSILCDLAECYRNLQDTKRAEALLLSALEENPFHVAANGQLLSLYVLLGRYTKAFEYWRLDHGVEDGENPIGTIARNFFDLQDASKIAEEDPNEEHLVRLAHCYVEATLYSDALTLWRRIQELFPNSEEASPAISLLESYLHMVTTYTEVSIGIYKQIAHGTEKDVASHRQLLYDVLKGLGSFFPALLALPKRCTKSSWESIREFYLDKFHLVIKDLFDSKVQYGTFVSYVVNERYYLLDPGYNPAQTAYRELAKDVVLDYGSWVFSYFGSATGGWVDKDKIIYRCLDRFKSLLDFWIACKSDIDPKACKVTLRKMLAEEKHGIADIFFVAPLAELFCYRYMHSIEEEARVFPDPKKRQHFFLKRCYETSINTTLLIHDSKGEEALSLFAYLKVQWNKRRSKGRFWTEKLYEAKLGELQVAETPYFSLQRMMTRDLGTKTPHGQSSTLIFRNMVLYIIKNPVLFPKIDTKKNILLQLDRLDAKTIKEIACSIR